jgi:DNA-binding phage protein
MEHQEGSGTRAESLGEDMPKTKTRPWDAAEHLETEEDMAAYLEAVIEEGDSALAPAALGDISRGKGMAG